MPVTCRDSCGVEVATEKEAEDAGWQHLEIQKRWRCPACWQALRNVDSLRNKEDDSVQGT